MKVTMIYDDTYTGPRFTYGLKYRPLAQSQVPDGWIIWSNKNNKDYKFGTVDYPFELDLDTTKSFEIERVEL